MHIGWGRETEAKLDGWTTRGDAEDEGAWRFPAASASMYPLPTDLAELGRLCAVDVPGALVVGLIRYDPVCWPPARRDNTVQPLITEPRSWHRALEQPRPECAWHRFSRAC